MTSAVAELDPGEILVDRWVVKRRLRGSPSPLYEVQHETSLERRTVVVLPPDLPAAGGRDPAAEACVQQSLAAARLEHPHIAALRGSGLLDSGQTYVILELLDGVTLSAYRGKRTLSGATIARIAGQLAEALSAGHLAGILHRGLRPDAIVVLRGEPLIVKVVDFALPEPSPRDQTPARACYESPEQFRGDGAVDERTDVYSLGVVLYELAAGRRPFDTDTLDDLLLAIAQEPPEPLETVRADLGRAFAEAVRKAMDPDPVLRFATPDELAREVTRALDPGELALTAIASGNDRSVADNRRSASGSSETPAGSLLTTAVGVVLALGFLAFVGKWAFAPRQRPFPVTSVAALEAARSVAMTVRRPGGAEATPSASGSAAAPAPTASP